LNKLVWSKSFARTCRRIARKDPRLRPRIEKALHLLSQDPTDQRLRAHKLKGELEGVWACSVDYNIRVLFEFVENPDTQETEILLLTLGSHDEVY
jgi:addiction module RelE/StbE family toxin